MPKRLPLLALFLAWPLALDAPAGSIEVARVPMQQLAPLQWELLRQQQGGYYQPLHIDVNLAIRYGKIIGVRVRRGTGHGDIDKAIVKWIEANWETYPWFVGGDDYVISMNVDPGTMRVVFRRT